jgi:hypothetical protein
MTFLEQSPALTSKEKQDARFMYPKNNNIMNCEILQKLIELGADVTDHDIYGFTPLHYAVLNTSEGLVHILLKHGANPNSESINHFRPLSYLKHATAEWMLRMVDILIQYNARLFHKEEINALRSSVETYGDKELAAKVREAHPRHKNECEKCVKSAANVCTACGLVYYCTQACQKVDWKFHKITCRRKKHKDKK